MWKYPALWILYNNIQMYFWFDLFLSYSTKNQQLFKRLKGQSLYSKAQWKSGKAAELMLVEEHQENKESGEHQKIVPRSKVVFHQRCISSLVKWKVVAERRNQCYQQLCIYFLLEQAQFFNYQFSQSRYLICFVSRDFILAMILKIQFLTWLKNFSLKAANNSWRIFFELRVHYNNNNREAQFGAKWAYLDSKWH